MARQFIGRRDQIPAVAQYVSEMPPAAPARDLTGGDAAKGEMLYKAVCTNCHGADGGGMVNSALYPDLPNLAPSLLIADDWYMLTQLKKFKGGVRGVHPQDPYGTAMANMAQTLTDEPAMMDVIAYIKTLPN
jgi:cytochrome c oxidase subunit 2